MFRLFSYSREDTADEEVEATKAVIEQEIARLREREREMEREAEKNGVLGKAEAENDTEQEEIQEQVNGEEEGEKQTMENKADDDTFYESREIERPQTPYRDTQEGEVVDPMTLEDKADLLLPESLKQNADVESEKPAIVEDIQPEVPPLNMRRMRSKDPRWPSRHENDAKTKYSSRDSAGYGHTPPNPKWPGGAKVAINFVLNYEEGGEACPLHGDATSETYLTDLIGLEKSSTEHRGDRHINMESLYDYGSRAGFWRLHRLFTQKQMPCTVFAVGMALERNQQACKAMKDAGWEVSSHGYRSLDYRGIGDLTQLEHIMRTIKVHEELIGRRPAGFFQGKPNQSTRRLVCEAGGFLYDSDSYADDLPYWSLESDQPHLIIPYSLTENDMRFVSPNGFHTGREFFEYLKETLDALLEEGREGRPKFMTVGLHCRIIGRPGRSTGLAKFMDHVKKLDSEVWVCTREQVAKHWYDTHYPVGQGSGYEVPINSYSP